MHSLLSIYSEPYTIPDEKGTVANKRESLCTLGTNTLGKRVKNKQANALTKYFMLWISLLLIHKLLELLIFTPITIQLETTRTFNIYSYNYTIRNQADICIQMLLMAPLHCFKF
jgi:hypothetical protein